VQGAGNRFSTQKASNGMKSISPQGGGRYIYPDEKGKEEKLHLDMEAGEK